MIGGNSVDRWVIRGDARAAARPPLGDRRPPLNRMPRRGAGGLLWSVAVADLRPATSRHACAGQTTRVHDDDDGPHLRPREANPAAYAVRPARRRRRCSLLEKAKGRPTTPAASPRRTRPAPPSPFSSNSVDKMGQEQRRQQRKQDGSGFWPDDSIWSSELRIQDDETGRAENPTVQKYRYFFMSRFLNSSFDLGCSSPPAGFASLLDQPRGLTDLGTANVALPVNCKWPPRLWEADLTALLSLLSPSPWSSLSTEVALRPVQEERERERNGDGELKKTSFKRIAPYDWAIQLQSIVKKCSTPPSPAWNIPHQHYIIPTFLMGNIAQHNAALGQGWTATRT